MKFQSRLLLQLFSTLSGICGPSLESPVLHAPCMELCNLYTSVFYLSSVFQLYTVQWCPLLSCVFGNSRLKKDLRPSKRVALLVCSRSAVLYRGRLRLYYYLSSPPSVFHSPFPPYAIILHTMKGMNDNDDLQCSILLAPFIMRHDARCECKMGLGPNVAVWAEIEISLFPFWLFFVPGRDHKISYPHRSSSSARNKLYVV